MNPAAGPAAAKSTDLVLRTANRPKRITIGDRIRRLATGPRFRLRHEIADLRAWLAAWPGWDRPPATRSEAWQRSEELPTARVPADSQLLIFFWLTSNYTDRIPFFGIAILVDGLTRKAPARVRSILVTPLYHLAEHPARRLTTYLALIICLNLAG